MTIAAALNMATDTEVGDVKSLAQIWQGIAKTYASSCDGFSAFLAQSCAEVLAEKKPANLIRLAEAQTRPCGHSVDDWRAFGQSLLANSPLKAVEIPDDRPGQLLLVYHKERFWDHLHHTPVAAFLQRLGYKVGSEDSTLLDQLLDRFNTGSFPHEIGVFLGYPLKDVAGFLGMGRLRHTAKGPWKVYGNPVPSVELALEFKRCRYWMLKRLSCQACPVTLLNGQAA